MDSILITVTLEPFSIYIYIYQTYFPTFFMNMENKKEFYLDNENQILFQKIRPYTRDIDLEKQVHYHHMPSRFIHNTAKLQSDSTESKNPPILLKDCDSECLMSCISVWNGNFPYDDLVAERNTFVNANRSPFIKKINQLGKVEFLNSKDLK
ncbi:hypothetical protein AYI68_g7456 [Smittium mucronatum]|uniref:Uncharacterized protein n=1 Tax=Smittium mucronatum TaxID=133383 RepID=A0A1R0GNN5_9FUNG|nr:hypothetical protein AYI68_g7456 [Smittium mucronatum]